MDKILIVLLAYVGVSFINFIDLEYQSHYFLACAFYFSMFALCFKSKDKLVYIYSYVNALMLFFCVNMLLPSGYLLMAYWVYDSTINLSDIVMAYEIFMVATGAINVLLIMVHRRGSTFNLRSNDSQGGAKCQRK